MVISRMRRLSRDKFYQWKTMGPWSHPKMKAAPGANASPLSIRKMRASGCLNSTAFWALLPLFLSARQVLRKQDNRLGFVLFCFREANGKTRAAVVTIFSRESSGVCLDDTAGNRQSH